MVAGAFQFESIVLVDDSDVDLFITEKILEIAQITSSIKSFNNPVEALSFLKEGAQNITGKHLIFLDINMPFLNGFQFLKEFEKILQSTKGNYSVVMLSSSNDPADVNKANESHLVKSYLQKPLSKEALDMI